MHLLIAALGLLVACASSTARAPIAATRWQRHTVDNEGVTIEYWVKAGDARAPVVIVPGMTGSASDYVENDELSTALGPRMQVAISLRARGGSSAPTTGYTPEDHHRDIAAVVRELQLRRYHLLAHSMGVAYSVGYALGRPPGEIESFVAGDYVPAIPEHTEEWAAMVESTPSRRVPRDFARNILREQGEHDYAAQLVTLTMPILVIFGTQSMEPDVAARWSAAPNHRVVWIDDGHDTFHNAAAIREVAAHLEAADASRSR